MIENIIKDMVESNTTGRLTDASKRFVARMKEKNEIKKLLVDNSRFFAGYEANADKIAADIANVLSEENLSQLAADLSRDSGYTFKARLEKWLTDLMSEYEIPHEEERLYANRILDAVLYELPQVAPDKYDRYYQSEWREEQQQEAQEIISKLEKISSQMAVYAEKHMDICSTDDLDLQLKRQTVNPKIGIDFFDIDDDEFISVFNEVKNDEKVCVRARCKEETIYCIINELWKSGEKRPIFVVKNKKDWYRLAEVGGTERHINFLYDKGNIYKIHNGNLLFHGCVPLDEQGVFDGIVVDGKSYTGREYLDYCESMVRQARTGDSDAVDFMWFLWSNILSPVTGRCIKTFERTFLDKEKNADYNNAIKEDKNHYYAQYEHERICKMILREFNLYNENAHIINGHTPVRTKEGQHPVRANGKLIVIDGGFCEGYHDATGIAGYTLIYNSHGMKIKEHHPFMSINMAINSNRDIESESQVVYVEKQRVFVKDTDNGKQIAEEINDLMNLLEWYNT